MEQEEARRYYHKGQPTHLLVTRDGRIFSEKTQRWLAWNSGGVGGAVSIRPRMSPTDKSAIGIGRMVASVYIPKPPGKDYVVHLDGNRWNNRVENLKWVSKKEIFKYSSRNRILVIDPETGQEAGVFSAEALAELFGVTPQTVRRHLGTVYHGVYLAADSDKQDNLAIAQDKPIPLNKYDMDGNFIASYPSSVKAALSVGCSPSSARANLIGKKCKASPDGWGEYRGYKWRIADDIVSSQPKG